MIASPASESVPHFYVSAPVCAEGHGATRSAGCSFRVAWAINPHMRVGAADPERAVRQHGAFVGALRARGARVDVLPFVHGAYDSVFAKDSAVVIERAGVDEALLASPLHPERRAEQRDRRRGLEAAGVRVTSSLPTTLEGGDVVIHSDRDGQPHAYLGFGFRSERRSAAALERFLGIPVTPLELRSAVFYHLDTALAGLGPVTFVCEEALTAAARSDLERVAGRDRLIPVSSAEARLFALNFVAVGDAVILAKGPRSFERRLGDLGYRACALPLTEFQLAGGSAACLVARAHPLDRVAVKTTAAIRSTAA